MKCEAVIRVIGLLMIVFSILFFIAAWVGESRK